MNSLRLPHRYAAVRGSLDFKRHTFLHARYVLFKRLKCQDKQNRLEIKMPTKIDDATKRRLIYVKKLYLHGHEHISYQTEFDRMIAIHHLDNAVELLLRCVATKYGISFKKPLFVSFPKLWDAINQRFLLPKKTEIFQLHNLRSNIQHWGISPFSSEIVKRFDVYVSDFIREVLEQIFRLDFEELFMSSLIRDKTLRKILTIAEKAFEKRNYKKCMLYADAAFNQALRQQKEKFGFFIPYGKEEVLEEIANTISILTLGIDYRDYKKFAQFAPHALWDENEEVVMYPHPLSEIGHERIEELEKKQFSRENSFFSLNFVLNCILCWHL